MRRVEDGSKNLVSQRFSTCFRSAEDEAKDTKGDQACNSSTKTSTSTQITPAWCRYRCDRPGQHRAECIQFTPPSAQETTACRRCATAQHSFLYRHSLLWQYCSNPSIQENILPYCTLVYKGLDHTHFQVTIQRPEFEHSLTCADSCAFHECCALKCKDRCLTNAGTWMELRNLQRGKPPTSPTERRSMVIIPL